MKTIAELEAKLNEQKIATLEVTWAGEHRWHVGLRCGFREGVCGTGEAPKIEDALTKAFEDLKRCGWRP